MSHDCVVSVSTSSPDLTLVGGESDVDEKTDFFYFDSWNKELAKFSVCVEENSLSVPEIPRPNSAPGERLLEEGEGDEDFTFEDILYFDEKEEQTQANVSTRTGYSESNETPIIDEQSASNPARLSEPHNNRQCQNSGELYRNVLNQVQQQGTYSVVRSNSNTLFRPVIPVINEDSVEEHALLTEELGFKQSARSGRHALHSAVQSHMSNQRTMNSHLPKKKSSLSEMSSTDEDSYSSEEDTANFREYRKQTLPPESVEQRRHSIASSSVDHLAQILSCLQKPSTGKTGLDRGEKCHGGSTTFTSSSQPHKSISENNLTLEWIRESDFDSHQKIDDRPSSENKVQSKESFHSSQKPGRPRRRFSVDISNLPNLGPEIEDPSFAREILHQKIIQLASSQDSINEKDESEDSNSKSSDISEQRTRRLSLGNLATAGIQGRRIVKKHSEPLMGSSSNRFTNQESENMFGNQDLNDHKTEMIRLSSRMRQRRSSWACAGAHPTMQKVSRSTLLNGNSFSENTDEEERSDVKDPYRLTLHFISDPKQSKKLKALLRPLTHSVAPKLKLFNYADRSERLVIDNKEPDVMAIPALAIMAFLQEEQGIERILKAQQYMREEPWQLHHKDTVGGNAVPYPTNNQDFYSHADGMPLWAVRQMHMGKDRLRFMLFVSHDNWDDTVSFYSKILSRTVQFQKEDFCYFLVFCCKKLNLEVQLALKRLPVGFVPTPLDAAILQFKVQNMGQLVPLMPRVCSPISATRWQTTDLDGNKILLLVHHENAPENTGTQTPRNEPDFESSGKSSPQSDNELGATDKNHNYSLLINYV